MSKIKELKENDRNLQSHIFCLAEDISKLKNRCYKLEWRLDNPPKFKNGDVVIYEDKEYVVVGSSEFVCDEFYECYWHYTIYHPEESQKVTESRLKLKK